MTLNERLTTKLAVEMAPALRVATDTVPIGVALRYLGSTKPHSARLDVPGVSGNGFNSNGVSRP